MTDGTKRGPIVSVGAREPDYPRPEEVEGKMCTLDHVANGKAWYRVEWSRRKEPPPPVLFASEYYERYSFEFPVEITGRLLEVEESVQDLKYWLVDAIAKFVTDQVKDTYFSYVATDKAGT